MQANRWLKTALLGATPAQSAGHLPVIHGLDRQGLLGFQSTGRMPVEVWDTIAELL